MLAEISDAIDLALMRLNQRIKEFPPFSYQTERLVKERNRLIEARRNIQVILPDERDDPA